MTKKDFQMIAVTIRAAYFHAHDLKEWAEWFADELEKTNVRFDRQRFIDVVIGERES